MAFLVYYFASGNSHPAGTAPQPASPTGVLGEAVPGDQHPGLPPLWVTANSCLWTNQALDGLQRWPHSTLQAPSWTEGALGTSVLPPPPTVRVCKIPGQPRNMVPSSQASANRPEYYGEAASKPPRLTGGKRLQNCGFLTAPMAKGSKKHSTYF